MSLVPTEPKRPRGPPHGPEDTSTSASKRPRPDGAAAAAPSRRGEVPTLRPDPTTGLIPQIEFREAYERYQAVYLPRILNGRITVEDRSLSWGDLAGLFDSLGDEDRKTWTIENAGANGDGPSDIDEPGDFLRRRSSTKGSIDERRGYCSFLVQKDLDRMKETLGRLPLEVLPISAKEDGTEGTEKNDAAENVTSSTQSMGPCLWFFFGRNGKTAPSTKPLEGRPEHTDSVSHDGTWHYQLSGVKEWHLRPTAELLRRMSDDSGDGSVPEKGTVVTCREGDVLLVNTRLWWHRTVIPPQELASSDRNSDANKESEPVPSVSYARDLYFSSPKSRGSATEEQDDPAYCQPCDGGMTNVDGLYAADDIEARTVVFTEHDMPDCELHRSKTDPNCELVQLEDGTGAIVSRRGIKAGEFFCIAESSDEEVESEDGSAEDEEDDT